MIVLAQKNGEPPQFCRARPPDAIVRLSYAEVVACKEVF
jgi:hypothetical protein